MEEGGELGNIGFLFGVMETFWNLIVVMAVQRCEYTKTH